MKRRTRGEYHAVNEFFDLLKNILICCCLCATLLTTCVQERQNSKMDAQISALKAVAVEMQECSSGACPLPTFEEPAEE